MLRRLRGRVGTYPLRSIYFGALVSNADCLRGRNPIHEMAKEPRFLRRVLIECGEAAVGDRDRMDVPGEVCQHGLRPCEGALGADDPLDRAQRREPLGKAGGIGQLGVLAEQVRLAPSMGGSEFFKGSGDGLRGKMPEWAGRGWARRDPPPRILALYRAQRFR